MGIFAGPGVIEDGLVLALDAANLKGYDNYENILLYSEDFSNAYWTKSNVSVTSNAITSPTGSSNASKLVESASTAVHELIRGSDGALSVGTDTYITFSIFAKAAERQYCYIRSGGNSKRIAVVVDLSNGTFNVTNFSSFSINSSATVTPYPNGWYRITATAQSNYPAAPGWAGQFIVSPIDSYQSSTTVGGSGYSYAGNGTSGIYIWGAHYEFGPGISDYYATTGTAKTRGTTWTDLSIGGGNNGTLTNGPTYSSSNRGSIVFDGVDDYVGWNTLDAIKWQNWSSITVETVFRLVSYSGSTNGRQYLFDYRDSGGIEGAFGCFYDNNISPNGFKLFYNTTGTSYEEPLITTFSLGTLIYHQVTFDKTTSTNNIRHYINGNNVFTRSVTVNSTTTNSGRIWLGRFSGGGYHWNGNIFLHRVYNRALTATEIQKNFNAQRGRFGI